MKYGYVNGVTVFEERESVEVKVSFTIDPKVLYEFMDCLKPVDKKAKREPILAILEHSAIEDDCDD